MSLVCIETAQELPSQQPCGICQRTAVCGRRVYVDYLANSPTEMASTWRKIAISPSKDVT